MAYKPSKARYKGKTRTMYAVWSEPQKYRGGAVHRREHAKKFHVSGKLKSVTKTVDRHPNKMGSTTKGIKVVYENPVKGYTAKLKAARYDKKRASVGMKTATVTKIVSLPGAKVGTRVRITSKKPKSALSID